MPAHVHDLKIIIVISEQSTVYVYMVFYYLIYQFSKGLLEYGPLSAHYVHSQWTFFVIV